MERLRLLALLKDSLRVSKRMVEHMTFRDELDEAYEIIEKLYQQQRDEEWKQKRAAERINGGDYVCD